MLTLFLWVFGDDREENKQGWKPQVKPGHLEDLEE